MPSPECSRPADRRLLHHYETAPLEVRDQLPGDDRRHEFVGVVDALAALKLEPREDAPQPCLTPTCRAKRLRNGHAGSTRRTFLEIAIDGTLF
jgi:hypothetical protein